jgi:hypothetical protein
MATPRYKASATAEANRDYRDAGVRQYERDRETARSGKRRNPGVTPPGNVPPADVPDTEVSESAQGNIFDSVYSDRLQMGFSPAAARFFANLAVRVAKGEIREDEQQALWTQSDIYKREYGAINDARQKNNPDLAPLSAYQINQLRDQYRLESSRYDLPSGFYDNNDDFDRLIKNDISPDEYSSRLAAATLVVGTGVDQNVRAAMKRFYGIKDGALAAYFLDPEKGEAALTREAAAATIGGAGATAGIRAGRGLSEDLVDAGYGKGEAARAFTAVQAENDELANLSSLEGSTALTDSQLVRGVTGVGKGSVVESITDRVDGLKSRERARFSRTGAGTNLLGTETSGSY